MVYLDKSSIKNKKNGRSVKLSWRGGMKDIYAFANLPSRQEHIKTMYLF